MIYAYDKVYLNSAQKIMGAMLHYAVYDCGVKIEVFYEAFLNSALSERFSKGDLYVIAGKSGVEIAIEVMGLGDDFAPASYYSNRSQEYWTGWALAYYQWYSGKSFREIQEVVSILQIMEMYHPYHEMDIMQFVDKMNELRQTARLQTYLQKYRKLAGLSQKELAERTDIPLKTIQQYEQRRKNINKAQAEYIIRLSRALCCRPEQLLEIGTSEKKDI